MSFDTPGMVEADATGAAAMPNDRVRAVLTRVRTRRKEGSFRERES